MAYINDLKATYQARSLLRLTYMMPLNQLLVLVLALASSQAQLQLVLEDNFDTFNFSLWRHHLTLSGGGNFEFQYYNNNRTNSYVRDGMLYIKPTLLEDEIGTENVEGNGYSLNIWGSTPGDYCTANFFYGCRRVAGSGGNVLNPIKSASLRTADSFYFKYGKVEVRAKLPKGDWLWPAIWLLPRWNIYGTWPASGEIDIMEARGNPADYTPGGSNTYGSTLHWGPVWTQNSFLKTHQVRMSETDLSDDFHVYGFIWNETYIGTYFDTEDQMVLSHNINQSFWELGGWGKDWNNPWQYGNRNAPFDSEFFLIINLAVGGTTGFFPDGYGKPWNNTSPHSVNEFWSARDEWYPTWTQPMIVDYVRVWCNNGQSSSTTTTGTAIIAITLASYLSIILLM